MNRDDMVAQLTDPTAPWDLVVIGGGATGLGTAVHPASRGYDVALLEQADFAKGTSSRSTKLMHGGVRYLQQGNVSLVMEALEERGVLLRNAPHLVHDAAFIVSSYAGRSRHDRESGEESRVRGRAVINATGPFAHRVRRLDQPDAEAMIEPSQGVHVVLDRSFLPRPQPGLADGPGGSGRRPKSKLSSGNGRSVARPSCRVLSLSSTV